MNGSFMAQSSPAGCGRYGKLYKMADSRPLEKLPKTAVRNFKQCIKRSLYGNILNYRYRPVASFVFAQLAAFRGCFPEKADFTNERASPAPGNSQSAATSLLSGNYSR